MFIQREYGSEANKRVNIKQEEDILVLQMESDKNHWVITAFKNERVKGSVNERNSYNNQNPKISTESGAPFSTKSSANSSEGQRDFLEDVNFAINNDKSTYSLS